MKIGLVGLGTIATAVAHNLAQKGHEITVSMRGAAYSQTLIEQYPNVTRAENQEVVDHSDVVILGLLADVARDIVPSLRFAAHQRVISVMADASLEEVAQLAAPAQAAALMIPFPAIEHGGSALPVLGDAALIQELFAQTETVIALEDQEQMNVLLAGQAVLSPVTKLVAETADWMGEQGLPAAKGEAFLRQLVASSLQQSGAHELLAHLSTPGGFNEAMRNHMVARDMPADLRAGLEILYRRTQG